VAAIVCLEASIASDDWLAGGCTLVLLVAGLAKLMVLHLLAAFPCYAGNELLVAGPTAWGTELQLPDSWVEAIEAAQLPEEQPLMQSLEVRAGVGAKVWCCCACC
jgi:hypothetical protein